jgi:protein ImuA
VPLPVPHLSHDAVALTGRATSDRRALIASLRARIRAVERTATDDRPNRHDRPDRPVWEEEPADAPPQNAHVASAAPPASRPAPVLSPPAGLSDGPAADELAGRQASWRLGSCRGGAGGLLALRLAEDGMHEIKPAPPETGSGAAPAAASAQAFALMLAIRRLRGLPAAGEAAAPPVLWCTTLALAREIGRLHAPGVERLGLAAERLVVVEAGREAEVLWALEEGLRSGSLALAVGVLDRVGLTPARRLSLAAAATRTPCLLVTAAAGEGTAATLTRWRVAAAPSAPHPLDPIAPGARRFAVHLERCRDAPALAVPAWGALEWCDVSYRFRLAPLLADRAAGVPRPSLAIRRAAAL